MKKKFYGKILIYLFGINKMLSSETIWTDSDFLTDKGHTWISSSNPIYGGDVHIKNINSVKFSSNMSGKPHTGLLGVETGGKLTADGEVIVEQLGPTTGNAVLISGGGKAYLNGGLTAVIKNSNNAYFAAAARDAGSELHVKGNTNLFAEFETGKGLYLGENTVNSFNKDSNGNGILNISAGNYGISSHGNTDFNQKVNIKLNDNDVLGIITYDTVSDSLSNFNEKVNIDINAISDNTSTSYGISVNNANGIINLNAGAAVNFGETYTNGNEVGIYSGKGALNIKGDLWVKTNSGKLQLALYAVDGGTIDISDSTLYLKGDIRSNNGRITMNSKEGSVWIGSSSIINFGSIDVVMNGTIWNMTNNSVLNNLNLLNNSKIYLNSNFQSGNFIPRTLTIDGNYYGNNGYIFFNTELNGDYSLTDKLIITGDTSGNTKVEVTNIGGIGAETLEGIELISVGGNSEGEFEKSGRIVVGTYEYFLNRGNDHTTNSKNWYLSSSLTPTEQELPTNIDPVEPAIPPAPPVDKKKYRPELGSYLANNSTVNTLFLHSLYDRLGDAQYVDVLSENGNATSIWIRNIGGYKTSKDIFKQLNNHEKTYVLQVGGDIAQWSTNKVNRYHLGIMGGYGFNHNTTSSNVTDYNSKGKSDGYNIGIYGTWFSNNEDRSGLYIDTWLTYNWFDNEVHGDYLEKEKYSSKGVTSSIEGGYTFRVDNYTEKKVFFVQPKAQAIYMGVETKDHTESNGTVIKFSGTDNIQTRLGMRMYTSDLNTSEIEKKVFQPFAEATWIHNQKDFGITMNGVNKKKIDTKDLGEIKLGAEIKLNRNLNTWGHISYQWGKNKYTDTAVSLGLKYSF